jgi:protein O-mannosyl-transferase
MATKAPSTLPVLRRSASAAPLAAMPLWLIASALAALTLAVFARVATCGFVGYDDGPYILDNAHLPLGLSWDGIKWAFTGNILGLWHPLTLLSLQADYQFFGYNAAAYHLHNLLYHTANVVLLFFCLHAATADRWRSALVAALFTIHPLRVESVAWAVEQKDTLSTLFVLLSMLGYIRFIGSRSWLALFLSLLAFVCSILAKPMYVTLPVLLLLLDIWPLRRLASFSANSSPKGVSRFGSRPLRVILLEKLPFVAVVFLVTWNFLRAYVSAVIRHVSVVPNSGAVQTAVIPGIADPTSAIFCLQNSLVSYVRYLGKIFWFKDLAVVYPEVQWTALQVAASVIVLLALSALAFWQRRQRPWILVGWFWFLLVLLPVNNIAKFGPFSMADRCTYLASVGIMIALTWSLPDTLLQRADSRRLWMPAFAAVILVLSIFTFIQIGYWKDSVALNTHAIEVTEGNYVCHINLGFALHAKGDEVGAATQYQIATELRPNEPVAHINLGSVWENARHYAEAIDEYTKAALCDPGDKSNAVRLVIPYAALGQTDRAMFCIQHAQQLGVNTADLHNAIGFTHATLGHNAEARQEFLAALALDPNYTPARINLARLDRQSTSRPAH